MRPHLIALSLALALCGSSAVAAEWGTDLAAARQEAAATKRPILMNFSGSDYCGPCIKLKREVFDSPAFTTWIKDRMVLLTVDFPIHTDQTAMVREQNQALQIRYRVPMYPTVVITDAAGNTLGRLGAPSDPEAPPFFVITDGTGSPIGTFGGREFDPDAWIAALDKILAQAK